MGLRKGPLTIGRFAAKASLKGGTGEVRASISGSRGRAFAIQTVTQVTPDRYTIRAEGTVDRRDLTLLTPAVVTREGAGWRLAKTRLSRSEEHTSELQSLMRISYAVFCLKNITTPSAKHS